MSLSSQQPSSSAGSPATALHCAAHPQVETNLRCGKCGKPICPKCMVQTPVGARCPECAQLRRPPQYTVAPGQYFIALGAALGLGAGLGFFWGFLSSFLPFVFYLNFLVFAGVGYSVGEVTGVAVNRKRGLGLQVVASLGVFIAFLTAQFRLVQAGFLLFSPLALFNPWNWLALALGIYVAAVRLK